MNTKTKPQTKLNPSLADYERANRPDSPVHLAHAAWDETQHVKDGQRAFEALEMLITPIGARDDDRIDCGRSDLGALLRVLNENLRQRVERACAAAEAARHALRWPG